MHPFFDRPPERPPQIPDDPDVALELRENLADFARLVRAEEARGKSATITAEQVADGLGLKWQSATYQTRFISLAHQILARWENAPIAPSILSKLQELAANFDAIEPEPIAGQWSDLYKLRLREHRVIYNVNRENKMITVYLIGHWRELHKRQT
ncbi:MAG TPA: type II toxin-antitoxin system RelE/ParE family toxin [Anaerolineales bacterium]|nr:type II toxin-antitoxin system RelE/ParE family toxin [Anaerolineales bacterium]